MADPLDLFLRTAKDAGCPRDQIENFLRHRIVLQPKQLQASAAARLCDRADGPSALLMGGARGGGKSHWGLGQVFCDDCARYPGLKFLYLRKSGKSGKEAITDLRRDVLHSTPHDFSMGVLTRRDNGSRIVLGHFQNESDVDNYLGLQYDGALIEEATQLSSRKLRDIGTCIRSSKRGWRPRKYLTTNPGGVGHAHIKRDFVDPHRFAGGYLPAMAQAGRTRFIPATLRDNAFLNPEYLAELELLTGWQRRAWLDGDWDIAAGQFFTNFLRERHVIAPIEIPRGWRKWCALDYGFTHYTCVHLLAEDNDGNIYAVDEHAQRGWLPQRHAAAIVAMLERNGLKLSDLWQFVAGADVFSKLPNGGTTADHYRDLGIKLKAANDDRINGAAELLDRLGDYDAEPQIPQSLFIFDRCAMLAECIPQLQHDPHRPEDVLKVDADEDGLGGDDPYDSFRYGLMEVRKKRKRFTVI